MAGHQGTSTRRDPHEALAAMIEAERRDVLTTAVGEIVSYDPVTQKANVRPRMTQRFGDKVLNAPDLMEVPVVHPRAGGFIVHSVPKTGDEVVLHFAQRSISDAVSDGKATDAAPGRMHSISDAFAVPASFSISAQASPPADRAHIGLADGTAGFQMVDSGAFDVVKGGDSLMAALADALSILIGHTNGGLGMDPSPKAALENVLARVQAMKA